MTLSVLVTRPNLFAAPLCDAIIEQGWKAIHLPTIAFRELYHQAPISTHQLLEFDWLIFISPFAVYAFNQLYPLPLNIPCAAIGQGSAAALAKIGMRCLEFPKGQDQAWNSEALLALPNFQAIAQKKIAIICGVGGRDLLAETLKQRGAEVTALMLYRRILPNIDISPFLTLSINHQINVILCTSFTSVSHLKKLFAGDYLADIQKIPLVVPSERIKILAEDLGFQTIWVARNMSNEAMIHTIKENQRGLI